MFADHNGIKLETSNRKTKNKSLNTWKQETMLLNNSWVKQEVSREIREIYWTQKR